MIYAKSVENHPITSDEIFEQILNRIIQLRLEPGQLISENQMSAEYGVSRSVIRTAFTRLKQLGFIEIYPQRGTYVSLMDLSHIADLLTLRTAVEKEVLYEIFADLGEAERRQMVERLEKNWRKLIQPEDTIVLAGDISWAMRLTEIWMQISIRS